MAILLGMVASAGAQQPRTRSLEYDPDRREWIEAPPPPPGTVEGDLHQIRVLVKDGENRQALAAIKRFIEFHGKNNVHYPEVLIERAQALIGRRDYHKAYVQLEEFLNEFGIDNRLLEGLGHWPMNSSPELFYSQLQQDITSQL